MDDPKEMLLGIQNLQVRYNAITAIHDVSLEINQGEIVTLIGCNGAGKTTLLRAISGLLHPSAGQIYWAVPEASPEIPAPAALNAAPYQGPVDSETQFTAPDKDLSSIQHSEFSIQNSPSPAEDLASTQAAALATLAPPPAILAPPPALVLRRIERMRPDQIVRLGISHVPEGRQIFPLLTVRENLRLGAYQRTDDLSSDIERCNTLFPILHQRRNQRAGTLSGGEQQMLAIARALMARPRLLLLDEPSLGLAPLVVRKIFDIIREINREGTTVFLVEQNAHMALKIAHRAYVLQTGQVIMSDNAQALLENDEVKKAYLGG